MTTSFYKAQQTHGILRLEGPDTAAFLHRLTSNDVNALEPGKGHYNALLTHKGKVLSLFYLYRETPESFFIFVEKDILGKTLQLISKMKFREKTLIQDVTAERSLAFLIGERASVEAAKITGADILEAEEKWGSDPFVFLSYPSFREGEVQETLQSIPALSEENFEVKRIRSGFPKYGIDITEDTILLESPVPVAYKRQKGCYPGQEVIERISSYGKGRTPHLLTVFFCEGNPGLTPGMLMSNGDITLGRVTSVAFDPSTQKTWGLGYVEQKHVLETPFEIGSVTAHLSR